VSKKKSMEQSEKVKGFLLDLVSLCRRHGLSLAHEDHQGAFIVQVEDENNIQWLLDALDQSNTMERR
jgi:hypothetical protein